MKIILLIFGILVFFIPAAFAIYECPDGSYADEGPCKLCPDGTYIAYDAPCEFILDKSYKESANPNSLNSIEKMGSAKSPVLSTVSVPYPGEVNRYDNVGGVLTVLTQTQNQQQRIDQRITVAFDNYLRQTEHKAFAYSNDGFYGVCIMKREEKEAKDCALINCAQYRQIGQTSPCYIWAFDKIVMGRQ